jgi:hypothetical protein
VSLRDRTECASDHAPSRTLRTNVATMGDRLTAPAGAMRDYYDQRADEYDSWWLGTGLFASR